MKLLCNTEQGIIHVDGRELTISHPDKVFWPEEGFTKRDVMTYYQKIYPHIKPYLKDRPQCLRRNPDGIIDRGFFQKDVAGLAPEWGTTIGMYAPSAKKRVHYLVCRNLADLLFMVNLGCIELNPWHSHIGSLKKPDYCVLDLDPGRHTKFATVIAVALQLKTIADEVELPMYCKTSGSRGLHLYIPLGSQHTYVLSRQLAYKLASIAEHMHPELVTLERSLKKRPQNKVYIDCQPNKIAQTAAAVYSLRPREGAPVSTPLRWEELKADMNPLLFNIRTIFDRLKTYGDLFHPVLGTGADIEKSFSLFKSL